MIRNYTYILKCSDNTLYTGWTNNLINRLKTHNNKTGAKYTRGRTPVDLIYYEVYSSRSAAQKRELDIKKLNRKEKLKLISNFNFSFLDIDFNLGNL